MKASRIVSYLSIFILGIALDQTVKCLTVLFFNPDDNGIPSREPYIVIKDIFRISYGENTGAAFSMFEGLRWLFIALTALIIIGIVFLLITDRVEGALARYSLVFIATGGAGNLIDRAMHGYVVDMFDVYCINFAVFNVADVFVTCATVLFILSFILKKGDVIKWKK